MVIKVGKHPLDTRIPPPLVGLIVALLMWNLSVWWPGPAAPEWRVLAVIGLVVLGASMDLAGVWAFRRARTTINPMKPKAVSTFVCGGVYRFTRNPMYLGMVFFLTAGVVYLWSLVAVLGPVIFVVYINRFQITPEERVLLERFGDTYAAYCRRVRRWL